MQDIFQKVAAGLIISLLTWMATGIHGSEKALASIDERIKQNHNELAARGLWMKKKDIKDHQQDERLIRLETLQKIQKRSEKKLTKEEKDGRS